jgi:hypothetical protein
MRKPKLGRPSAGLLLGALALVVAVAGNSGAFAGTKVIVRKGQIAKGAVTAMSLAHGAVHPAAISKGAVGVAALRPGSVDSSVLAPDAVTSGALAPGSVYGGALGEMTLHSAAIVDADLVPHNGEWTLSAPVTAQCAGGERVLTGGTVITSPVNGLAIVTVSQPFVNGAVQGWTGRIESDLGGLAKAEVQVLCLK